MNEMDEGSSLRSSEPSATGAGGSHNPCCSDHVFDYAMDCDRFRRTHIVEPGEDCCPEWAARGPQTWVPSGCPAGFSADCYYWTSNGVCRCWSPPAAPKAPSEASQEEAQP